MSITVTFSVEPEYLRAELTGLFSLDQAQATFLEILDASVQHHRTKILIQGTALRGDPTIIQRFLYSEFAADAVRTHITNQGLANPQIAYVLQEPVLDPRRFGETVALNRGMWVKVFDNPKEALAWLTPTP